MPQKKRVLYLVHGHPDFVYGGAEQAAFNMYQAMKDSDEYEPFFLARYGKAEHRPPGAILLRHEADDHVYLLPTDGLTYNYFFSTFVLENVDEAAKVHQAFRELLERLDLHILHIHHFSYLGIELIAFAKSILPHVRIVMTLHEFMPICAHHGSMVKTGTFQLCFSASPLKCCSCFPDRTPREFFLRERFFKANLAHVDRFIAPSQFLRRRFVEWGLDPDRVLPMDNGRPIWPWQKRPPRLEGQPFSVAFFGQIVFHKGVDVFLRAAVEYRRRKSVHKTEEDPLPKVRFGLHGSTLLVHDENIRTTIEELLVACKDVVHVHGPYDTRNMPALLRQVDCVVVPSRWWENSPLVIQEAFMAGIPVICSNIGGMAEKVNDRVNGLHFVVGNHFDLLNRVLELASSPELYEKLTQGIPEILSDVKMSAWMHELYHGLTVPASGLTTTAMPG